MLATGVSENVDILYNSRDRGSILKVEGHWPKGALLYMAKIKRFYVVHEPNENLCRVLSDIKRSAAPRVLYRAL